MDGYEFDELVRRSLSPASRRGMLRVGTGFLAASALAALGLHAPDEVQAKKKKPCPPCKKRKQGKCKAKLPDGTTCPGGSCTSGKCIPTPPACGGACGGLAPQCCPPTVFAPGGTCAAANDICCTPAQGGGACSVDFPKCCSPTTQDPVGLCTEADRTCCTSAQGGGTCSAEFPQCCPPTTQDPDGLCAEASETCCTSEQGGGLCPADAPQCCPLDLGGGCCAAGDSCCAIDDDCPGALVCDDSGCCGEAAQPRTRAVGGRSDRSRSAGSSRGGGISR